MVVAVLSLAFQSQQNLTYDGQAFRYGSLTYEVAPKTTEKNEKVVYRKDDAFVVWDSRGLTIRKGKKTFTTRFEDAALSPKLWTAEEIAGIKQRIAGKEAKREVSELIASLRIGDEVVCVVRWNDSKGVSWADVAYRASLTDESVKPALIGKWPGRLAKTTPQRATLSFVGSEVLGVTRLTDNKWGVGRVNLLDGSTSAVDIGEGLLVATQINRRLALVVEQASGRVKRLVRVDLFDSKRRDLLESTGSLGVLTVETNSFCVNRLGERQTVHDLQTGQTLDTPTGSKVAGALGGLLVYGPTKATLFDPKRMEVMATWVKPATPADPNARSRNRPKPPGRPSNRLAQ
ncbi:MAG TPA: hypothetical protein PKA27_02610 [Fimbriimonadaceae bacterium]|nr:hypothetical protein [Fimbriimonadaceae bacterium]